MSLWRLEDPALEDGNIVQGGMFPHQREWWHLPNFVRLLVGGYGCGKTLVLCKRMISLALENAPAPVAIVSPTYSMASETVISTMIELLDGKRTVTPGFAWWDRKTSPYRFFVKHGTRLGRILVYSGENPVRLKGPNLAAAGIDEPFIQDVGVLEQIIARLRHPDALRIELNLTGTPESLNWGYDLVEGDLAGQYDVGWVRATTHDNLALPTDYARRLEAAYDAEAIKAYVGGLFVNLTAGQVYYGFDPERNLRRFEKAPDGARAYAGMDFNVNPMAFVVGWRTADRIHTVREYELRNSCTESACAEIQRAYPGLVDIYPDASCRNRSTSAAGGRSDLHILKEAGFRAHFQARGNPPLRDRYNAANGALQHGRWTIDPGCKSLRKSLLAYSHPLLHTEAQKAMSHVLDAATYPIAYLFPVRPFAAAQIPVRGA